MQKEMTAYSATGFKIGDPKFRSFHSIFAEPEVWLPGLHCDACNERWRESEVWYPTLTVNEGVDKRLLQFTKTLPCEQFMNVRSKVVGPDAKNYWLPPGSGIGLVRAKVPKRATDFGFAGFKLLMGRRAAEIMDQNGVIIPRGPAKVRFGKEKQEVEGEFFAVQLDPVLLYTQSTLDDCMAWFCPKCGGYCMKDIRRKPEKPLEFMATNVPSKHGLVVPRASWSTLATEAFMEVYKIHGLTGLTFEPRGMWV